MGKQIKVYLHNNYSWGELQDCYKTTDEETDKLYNALYEVGLMVDLDTGRVVSVVDLTPRTSVEEYLKNI